MGLFATAGQSRALAATFINLMAKRGKARAKPLSHPLSADTESAGRQIAQGLTLGSGCRQLQPVGLRPNRSSYNELDEDWHKADVGVVACAGSAAFRPHVRQRPPLCHR